MTKRNKVYLMGSWNRERTLGRTKEIQMKYGLHNNVSKLVYQIKTKVPD
jgi:hypothetical protein